ncbi:amino acid adenylation domain-containing protein [Streptomyces sp. 4N509B]|uniref:amino acid adenylation domain-containing protein n=1 Tax=Streptomyces sp. 4N509B TaxID=3457413 RepID=UPI003FD39E6F
MRKPDGEERRLPLTTAQTGVWFSQALDVANPIFRAAEYLEVRGRLDVPTLDAALRQAVAETEAFRTRFEADDDGGVWQVVLPTVDWLLPVVDCRDAADPWAAAHDWMRHDMRVPFDLGRPPLFTFAVLRPADDRTLLYVGAHHVVLDGYGFSLFIQRVAELYTSLLAGDPPPPCTLGTLRELLDDEAAYLASERFRRDRDHWRRQLADGAGWWGDGGSDVPSLPRDLVRATGHLAAPAADRLRALARQVRSSLPAVAMAALGLYAHRLTGSRDVSLELTVTGRTGPVARRVPGMVANVLPLRLRPDNAAGVGELVGHASRQARDLLRHQRYPSPFLVRDPHATRVRPRGGSGGWNINIMGYDPPLRFGEHPATLHNLSNGGASRFGVNVYERTADGALRVDVDTDPAAHDGEATAAHLDRFLHLLTTLADAGPERRVGTIGLLTPAERKQVVVAVNETETPLPATTLPEVFEAQARRTPDATALVCGTPGGREWTFARLNEDANRLARLLVERGAGPESVVALALPRSAAHLVALLAVLKSGAASVPVDPEGPRERTRLLLRDARPVLVLTTAAHAPGLPPLPPPRGAAAVGMSPVVLPLDDPATLSALRRQPARDLTDAERRAPLRPQHAAYLAYTSGSTGRPNGVVVEHRQLTNLHGDHVATLIGPESRAAGRRLRAALTASFSFDTSWEGPLFLAAGHELHLVADGVRHDPAALVAEIARRRLDFLDLTPSLLRPLLAAGLFADDGDGGAPDDTPGGGHRPRVLMVGGEAIDPALWRRLGALPDTSAYNYYGPTECAVDAVYCRVADRAGSDDPGRPVIGRPGRNVRAYVLDGALQPQPPTVPGELYLAGEQTSRGYLGRPGLTACRFVADPFGPPGGRMYRTGDRARWTADGVLEFLGRVDEQLSVRGCRIEPGEVEHALARHPGVAQAAVAAREDASGEPALTAYVVPAAGAGAGAAPTAAALRAWAAARLPAPMVPATFLTLDALPVTRNGKLDRAALPAPRNAPADGGAAGSPGGARAPRGELERELCGLFAEVLDVPRLGPDDDFFDHGGHSALAVRLVSRIRARHGAELTVRSLFEAPTAAALARRLDATAGPSAERHGPGAFEMLLPLRAQGERPPLFCVHPAGGLSWCYAGLLRHLPSRVPVFGLQARGLGADAPELPGSFEEMITSYVARIRATQPAGPYRLLGWSIGGALAHAVAVRLRALGEAVTLLAMLDSRPIDPERAAGEHLKERELWALLLESVGLDPLTPDPPAVLAARNGLDERHVAALTAAHAHATSLLPTFVEGVFDGDLLYFRAAHGENAPELWRPWVAGRIASHDVAATHQAMTRAEALGPVGRVLAARLDDLDDLDGPGASGEGGIPRLP